MKWSTAETWLGVKHSYDLWQAASGTLRGLLLPAANPTHRRTIVNQKLSISTKISLYQLFAIVFTVRVERLCS
jgi:hypothetical protein